MDENQGPKILAVQVVLIVLAVLAVVLRFLSRGLCGAGVGLDDWLIVFALPFTLLINIGNIYVISQGFGHHAIDLPPSATSTYLHVNYFMELSYMIAVPITKFSILIFYQRIFKTKEFRLAARFVGGFVLLWGVTFLFAFMFQCTPIKKVWDFTVVGGFCINIDAFLPANAVPNILTDFVILCLPVHMVWKLQMPFWKKIAVSALFLSGGFVCAVSITRLVILLNVPLVDITWNFVGVDTWSAIEVSIGLVCACLPTHRPIFKLVFDPFLEKVRSVTGKSQKTGSTSAYNRSSVLSFAQKKQDKEYAGDFARLTDRPSQEKVDKVGALADEVGEPYLGQEMGIPLGHIHVKHDVEWTTSSMNATHEHSGPRK